MPLLGIQPKNVSKLLLSEVDSVTCLECCKYYLAPERASCGHALCQSCWKGRRVCAACGHSLDRRSLRLDTTLQSLTEHIYELVKDFQRLFGVKLEEFNMNVPLQNDLEDDATKNVKEWLTSSDNHFSAPPYSDSQRSTQDIIAPIELSSSKIQVHSSTSKAKSLQKVVTADPIPQDDWDKIEIIPDTEDICAKPKFNPIGPMDFEPFDIEENDYSSSNPRRSSRKRENRRELSQSPKILQTDATKPGSNMSSKQTDNKSDRVNQSWKNVKKMRKEFSKLNKKKNSKLNVSIEMCKKTQNKQNSYTPPTALAIEDVVIEDATPDICEVNVKAKSKDKNKSDEELLTKENNGSKADNLTPQHYNDRKEQNENTTVKQNSKESIVRIPFLKKGSVKTPNVKNVMNQDTLSESCTSNTDDIHITIRIGDVVTNIVINKKQNDVQLKVNTDREIQTSMGTDVIKDTDDKDNEHNGEDKEINPKEIVKTSQKSNGFKTPKVLEKSVSTKKHTDSAETASAQYEITNSVEKELSKIMECDEITEESSLENSSKPQLKTDTQVICKNDQINKHANVGNNAIDNLTEDIVLDDDIFNSGSVQEHNIQELKNTKSAPSEILVSTHKSYKTRSQKLDKRERELSKMDESEKPSKRQKTQENNDLDVVPQSHKNVDESENYDELMGQVFANIEAEMNESVKNARNVDASQIINATNKSLRRQDKVVDEESLIEEVAPTPGEKFSENMFSTVGNIADKGNTHLPGPETQRMAELLTPGDPGDEPGDKPCKHPGENPDVNPGDALDGEDSDKSVVEDTPQKSSSLNNSKGKRHDSGIKSNNNKPSSGLANAKSTESQDNCSIINLTDSIRECPERPKESITAGPARHKSLETPLTINRFVDQIKHKSTPVAKKSLNFNNNENSEQDDDATLCPTNKTVISTTQDKQFMLEAFEKQSPMRKPLSTKNAVDERPKQIRVAGSCLTSAELTNLKVLCYKRKWAYVDKYTPDLTHLVVAVDDENRSQRSVKYMCALAAGKFIVSYKWVVKCLESNSTVNEGPYEALDVTGDPGPMRSRLAKEKVFKGITFFCMKPFSVLDYDTLVGMLHAAGGRVVTEPSQVQVAGSTPCLLLAEPEHTQEDRFMYLAIELGIVPVNYEWALNCLGSYSLHSLRDLLLCPFSLLPSAVKTWPEQLVEPDCD